MPRSPKRSLDIVLSLVGLILSLPNMAVIALLVKLDSRGPILSREQRVSERGHIFVLNKFRSTSVDANPSVTRVGRWLRRTRLDRLPMLWGVLMGDFNYFWVPRLPLRGKPSHVIALVAGDLAVIGAAVASAMRRGYLAPHKIPGHQW